jgi:two-component system, NtrC family, response regulator AtoC
MSRMGRLMVVEDDEEMRRLLEEELLEAGHSVLSVGTGGAALECLEHTQVDLVVTDLMMPGINGDELLARVHAHSPFLPVVIITAFGSVDSAVAAVKAGAYHYLVKPFSMEQLRVTVENALRERRLWDEIRELREALGEGKARVVAESSAMKEVLHLILRAAAADTPVLLLGESGTGKEILARLLHTEGMRREGPFMAINCSAIPEALLESQLFGHRRGSFTDAREDRRGLFQEAEGGTLFLDEIGDMPLSLQGKILRVLQEKEIHPLGAPAPLKVDARVVAATHRKLEELMEAGLFRQDLYYRLNVIAVQVPPLRERPDDILPLAAHFLGKHGRRLGRSSCTLSSEVVEALRRYAWPGNVRELENAIERALVLGRDDVIWLHDLPEALANPRQSQELPEGTRPLAEVEREHILKTLGAVRWNKTAAARLLGMDRKTLHRKLGAFGIRAP